MLKYRADSAERKHIMPITELLKRNAELYGSDVALVEINPEITEVRRITWKEYELIEPKILQEVRVRIDIAISGSILFFIKIKRTTLFVLIIRIFCFLCN